MPYTDIGGFTAALATGTVSLAKCLRVVRKDGVVFGFTDFMTPLTLPAVTVTFTGGGSLTVPETTYRSDAGMIPTNITQGEDISKVDSLEVKGILGSYLTDADVKNKLFEGATWTLLLCDWKVPTRQQVRARGTIGEVMWMGAEVTFKLRSLSQAWQQEIIEVTSPLSRYDWGDPEMAWFDLTGNTHDGYAATVVTTVTSVSDARRVFRLAATVGFPSRRFENGLITFTSGANAGRAIAVMSFDPATGEMELWEPVNFDIVVGDAVTARIAIPLRIEDWAVWFGDVLRFGGEDKIVTMEMASDTKYNPGDDPSF